MRLLKRLANRNEFAFYMNRISHQRLALFNVSPPLHVWNKIEVEAVGGSKRLCIKKHFDNLSARKIMSSAWEMQNGLPNNHLSSEKFTSSWRCSGNRKIKRIEVQFGKIFGWKILLIKWSGDSTGRYFAYIPESHFKNRQNRK